MSEQEEPVAKLAKLEGSMESMDEGQEEWLSEGVLTDDDGNPMADNDSSAVQSQDETMESEPALEELTEKLEELTEDKKKDKENAAELNTDKIAEALDNMENEKTDKNEDDMQGDLSTFLVRKTDGTIVETKERREDTDMESPKHSDEDANDTDELLRMLGDDDQKAKKKKEVRKIAEKKTKDDQSTDEEELFTGKMTRLKSKLTKKIPPKAVPEVTSDNESTNLKSRLRTPKKPILKKTPVKTKSGGSDQENITPKVKGVKKIATKAVPEVSDDGNVVQVSSDSLVCHACWSNAWDEIRHPTNRGPIVGHVHICISCGMSLLRRRSHTLNTNSLREAAIRNMIAQQIAPRQMPRTTYLCHTCWRRTDRAAEQTTVEQDPEAANSPQEVSTVNTSQEDGSLGGSNDIFLPNYIRAPSTQRQCFYPGCNGTERCLIPSSLRVSLLCDYNYYVPSDCRICSYHSSSNSWELLIESIYNPIKTFSSIQIEEVFSLLKENMLLHLDFENIHIMPDHIVHYYLGFSKQQFQQILLEVPRLSEKHRGAFALAAYLMKLRTGDSDERIASLLRVPRSTLEYLMNTAREILDQDFVPRNLGLNHISREDISQRNLLIPNGLFGGEDRKPIIIADGTYLYIEKSSNYLYQKRTYSLHKYRNLVKPFLLVCSDGYIIDVFGPYPATTTDAEIFKQEFTNENSPCRRFFQPGDVFILDRGFRDSLPLLRSCGYNVHVPLSLEEGETQLSTRDANKTRAVTLCRWVVEVVNGIFKTKFKIFKQIYFNRASKHVMIDFSVAAALINKYSLRVQDREDAAEILDIVNRNMSRNNDLGDYVRDQHLNRVRADFRNITVSNENINEFPRLNINELTLIACGTYQLKQARSYYGEHRRFNGCYHIEICTNVRNRIMEGNIFGPNSFLLRARIASRHVSRKVYFVYILYSTIITGREAINQYYCNCIVGRRTVGCCAHVMTVLWYLGWARHQNNIFPPAQFLDEVLVVYNDDD